MNKKLVFIIIALSVLLTLLCSCGTPEEMPDASAPPDNTAQAADGEDEAPEETAEPEPEATPEPTVEPHMLGEYETPILNNDPHRVANLALACEKINAVVTEPEQEFSFNDTVGERTEERGFKKGIVFDGRKKTEAVGGGVCQVSTTLFGAAKNAALEITERHQHKREVQYVKLGDDATVKYGELDFKFKNTQSRPVKIEAFLTDSTVCVRIWAI